MVARINSVKNALFCVGTLIAMVNGPHQEKIMQGKVLFLCLLGSLALPGIAAAAEIDNTALTDPPGVYFGAGNSNSNFTVDREGVIEVGQSAITRFVGPIVPTGNTYDVPTGATVVAGKTGAAWGFTFSVNLQSDGGSLTLADIQPILSLQDVGNGATGSFNLLAIPDNSLWGSGGKCAPQNTCGALSNYYAFQNSEALSFASVAAALGDPAYDLNANDTYIFTLNVMNGTTLLASDTINVVAGSGASVPEPISLSLLGSGLLGLYFMRKKRKAIEAR